MNKLIIMCGLALLLTACANEATTDDKEVEKEKVSEVQEDEKKASDTEIKDEKENPAPDSDSATTEEIQPKYRMNEKNYSLEPIGEANPKVVLFTIDDAPDKYALEMAKTLKSLDAPAIFFVNGHFIHSPEKEEIVKEIYDLGFAIGNHTYSHQDLSSLTPEKQQEEIVKVNDIVEKITGERPKFFRAPFGKNTDFSRKIATEENMLVMNWTYGYDWEKQYMSKDAIANIMVNTELLRNGANLLMHDREWTNAGLEQMVVGLREKGYELLDPDLIETPTK